MKTMIASEFKAKCLRVLDEVAQTGEPVTILKRGRPVAQLVPAVARETRFPQEELIGSVQILGDIMGPVVDPEDWEAVSGGWPFSSDTSPAKERGE